VPAYVLGRGRPNRKYPPLSNRTVTGTSSAAVAAGTGGATITPAVTEPGAPAAFGVGTAALFGTAGVPVPDGVAGVVMASSNSGLAVLASAGVTVSNGQAALASPGAGVATLASPGLGQATVQI
jgi:hypothetical protein